MTSLLTTPLPYAQATLAQRTQLLHYLQARLRLHFPVLPERSFSRALAEFQPELLLSAAHVRLTEADLLQVVQYLGGVPELPLLDPPLFGSWALELAQHILYTNELTTEVIGELVAGPRTPCVPALWTLLQRLAVPHALATRVVQAQRWGLPGSPPLPDGRPGGKPGLDGSTVARQLQLLAPPSW